MDIKEKRKALADYCDDMASCRECPVHGCYDCEFDDAPEEMIHKWHAMTFPDAESEKMKEALKELSRTPIFADIPDSPVIKDSGERREFATGAVRDMASGKGRMDLLPWAAIMEVSKHCENGAIKYGEHNVDKGLPTSSFCDSAARHLAKYLDGWTDEPHLLAAAWNLLWAAQMTLKNPEMVDTPWKHENKGGAE